MRDALECGTPDSTGSPSRTALRILVRRRLLNFCCRSSIHSRRMRLTLCGSRGRSGGEPQRAGASEDAHEMRRVPLVECDADDGGAASRTKRTSLSRSTTSWTSATWTGSHTGTGRKVSSAERRGPRGGVRDPRVHGQELHTVRGSQTVPRPDAPSRRRAAIHEQWQTSEKVNGSVLK
jgi:hypothetical protein